MKSWYNSQYPLHFVKWEDIENLNPKFIKGTSILDCNATANIWYCTEDDAYYCTLETL